jgi:hypothetical protein
MKHNCCKLLTKNLGKERRLPWQGNCRGERIDSVLVAGCRRWGAPAAASPVLVRMRCSHARAAAPPATGVCVVLLFLLRSTTSPRFSLYLLLIAKPSQIRERGTDEANEHCDRTDDLEGWKQRTGNVVLLVLGWA